MARTLVVFFSRTGTTRTVAKRLASQLDADLEEIVDPTRRTGLVGWLRSGLEARRGWRAPIAPGRPCGDYGLVVIGTPMWAGCLSSPVRAYLRQHRAELGDVAFFCTRGGRGDHQVFSQMEAEVGRAPVATLTVREADLHTSPSRRAVEAFVARLRGAQPPATSSGPGPQPARAATP